MKRRNQFLNAVTEGMDLPGETLPGQTIVEIAGASRLLIENHFGVIQYSREQIRVKVEYGQVCICGCALELARMTKHQLVICGRIDSVSLLRREK